MTNTIQQNITIPAELAGMRLDQAVAKILPDFSRTQIKSWIEKGEIKIDGKNVKPKQQVMGGEQLLLKATLIDQNQWEAQNIPLEIVFEDDEVLVINKPINMVVHPGAGNKDNTLLNALLHYCPTLTMLPRAGILHRLDKNTTGLLLIAKTPQAYKHLNFQLKIKKINRFYQTIVCGELISGGTVDAPIGRHPKVRTRMAVMESGKDAVTHYRIAEKFRAHTRLKVKLETGRTHQIRVHMAHIHHPVLGDPIYGERLQLPKAATPALVDSLRQFKRQALHACELQFTHPITKKNIQCEAKLPEDMLALIKVLREDTEIYNQKTS